MKNYYFKSVTTIQSLFFNKNFTGHSFSETCTSRNLSYASRLPSPIKNINTVGIFCTYATETEIRFDGGFGES